MPNGGDRKRIFRSVKLLQRKSIRETVFVRLIHLTSSIALLSVFVETTSQNGMIEIFEGTEKMNEIRNLQKMKIN